MHLRLPLHQPHIRAKLLGSILLIISVLFFTQPTDINIKIGFTSLLIGLFMIVMITERSIPQRLSTAQINGNLNAVQQITKNLNLTGNAIFLPTSQLRSEERIFIPLSNEKTTLPQIDDDFVFATGADGTSLGIAIPPAGLPLLNELETETAFTQADLDTIEEKLQTFVGNDLLKTVKLTHHQDHYILHLNSPMGCTTTDALACQYPCPTCSAVLTAITRAAKQPLKITSYENRGNNRIYQFTLGE
ncbi:MAG: hypothetical protein KKC68_08885 [Candidatus Thermoplasmatota archaeon]|nr:hypothetical protein [Candidatus Thermoplasmatota archaeon]